MSVFSTVSFGNQYLLLIPVVRAKTKVIVRQKRRKQDVNWTNEMFVPVL
jgi:hypothetical protein